MRHILPRVTGEIPNGGLLWRAPAWRVRLHIPNSIRGLAQSIAKPAYRRLLTAEPLLRRAVPVLIIAFLATICVGALVQVLDHRRPTLTDEILSLEAVADFATERLQRPLNGAAAVLEQPQAILTRVLPTWGAAADDGFS